jgi:hypothetical protein
MRDWIAIAAGMKIELNDTMRQTLEGLDRALLGLRGLIDWQEEPIATFHIPPPEDDPE